jgi:hypothetical protein
VKQFVVMLAAATALTLGGMSPALATSDAGNENPDLTVTASLASRGTPNPDIAAVGDLVDTIVSIKNNKRWTLKPQLEEVRLRVVLQIPSVDKFNLSIPVVLLPEQTLRLAFDFPLNALFPRGLYTLTLDAFELSDPAAPPSSATVTLTIS